MNINREIAVFGAGCFWGVEESFRTLNGVLETEVGYAGGASTETNYKEVCTGTTGHAEVVKITYDPSIIKYDKLLNTFWQIHNPTTLNQQGPDIGTQYRSAIFFLNEQQKNLATASINEVNSSALFDKSVVTKLEEFKNYVKAEEYHQQYLSKRGQAVCSI